MTKKPMLELLTDELNAHNAFSEEVPDIISLVAESIPFTTVPLRMKYTIAVSEAILFASQFRRNIIHWDGVEVPINSVSFIITGSGQNKDSSVNAARRGFAAGYSMINDKRKVLAKQSAIKQATEAGVDEPQRYKNYKAFYQSPDPLFVAPSTNEGFIKHLNQLDADGIGSGFLYSGEFAAELSSSPIFVENLKLIAELYDLGNKEVKVLKAKESQSKEILGLPVSALFVSSPDGILYDEVVKKIFRREFATKYARRSNFCYAPEVLKEEDHDSIDNLVNTVLGNNGNASAIRAQISDGIKVIAEENLAKVGQGILVSDEARRLFIIYQRYNTEIADRMSKIFPISILVRRHLQWKALKLAGAISIFHQHDQIELDDYVQAIRFNEMLDKDMAMFETELVKEPYEVFADYMKSIVENGKAFASLHTLRKAGYVATAGNPTQKLKELAHLAASYDEYGVYTADDMGITYEQIIPTNVIAFSRKKIDVSEVRKAIKSGNKAAITKAKERIGMATVDGYEICQTDFAGLASILTGTYAYTPFILPDGKRDKDTLIAATKWVVFDIDRSDITASEAHFLLSDINHHIALTADDKNEFKFRVFVELDSVVELSATVWRPFYASIAKELALNANATVDVDLVPQSQIFFSYGADEVLSVTDGSPIKVRDHIMFANDAINSKPVVEKAPSKSQVEALINDPYTTFNYAYESRPGSGSGSRNLIRAARHARDLGLPKDAIIELIKDINDYWVSPMPEDRLETTIISQINRW